MPTPRTIVVGYDGATAGLNALRWALDHGGFGRQVVVVTSTGQERSLLSVPGAPGAEERAWELLGELRSHVETVVAHDAPAECIARVAAEREAELVVVGHQDREDREGLESVLHISVAGRLVDLAPCPVLVVRSPVPA